MYKFNRITSLVSLVILYITNSTIATCPIGDLNGDCYVNLEDIVLFSEQWLSQPNSVSDLNGDEEIEATDLAILAQNWRLKGIPLFINEFMASNSSFIQDPQGQYDDWIEIHNAGKDAIDIGGMYLTDDLTEPTKWQIPDNKPTETAIPAGGYLIIWADSDIEDPGLHSNFNLNAGGEEIGLFDRDGSTLIDSVVFGDQTTDISYGHYPDASSILRFFAFPTPGRENSGAYLGVVKDTKFSHNRGFYDWPISVRLSTESDDATIYYTLDGSEPGVTYRFLSGTKYTNPIAVNKTTYIRARTVKPGWMSSKVITHTYIFVNDVIRQSPNGQAPGPGWPTGSVKSQVLDYGMDPDVVNDPRYADLIDDALLAIPTFSLVTDLDNLFDPTTGIYVNALLEGRAWERPVSVELLNPDGSDGFQIDAGLRIRGGWRRRPYNPKHPFRLLFRAEYGQAKLQFPLFDDEGADEFKNIDLRTSQNYSWASDGDSQNTMVREVFSRDVQGKMGHPYTRSRYYHLYLNGHYWGLHQTQERSEASYAESYFGDDEEDYDVVKVRSQANRSMFPTDGNMDAYRRLYNAATTNLGDNTFYYRIQGLNPDGTPNPDYERMLDVDNLIDFMIIEYYTGDRDGPGSRFGNIPNNIYGIYNRKNPDGWKWFHHDNEHTLGVSQSEENMVIPFTIAGAWWRYFNPHWLHEQLITANADYRIHFADHVHRHFFNNGILTPENAQQLILNRAEQIDMAIIAESARWGDAKRSRPFTKEDWLSELNRLINNYLPYRTEVVLNQFKSVGWYPNVEAPTFSQHGGYASAGDILTMTNPNSSGAIYYTLDGSDPRLQGGAINVSSAMSYSEPITLTKSTCAKTRVLNGTTWSALSEAVFAVGPVKESLRIAEIMYHPLDTGQPDDPNTEFVELANIGAETINLNMVKFTNGIYFSFGDIELAPAGYILVVKNESAFLAKYPEFTGLIAGQYAGSLSNAGERIELQDAIGQTIHSFRYRDNWYDITDGLGFSLTVKDPASTDPNSYSDKSIWRPSAAPGGSPGVGGTL
jgi:hypothetical protein